MRSDEESHDGEKKLHSGTNEDEYSYDKPSQATGNISHSSSYEPDSCCCASYRSPSSASFASQHVSRVANETIRTLVSDFVDG